MPEKLPIFLTGATINSREEKLEIMILASDLHVNKLKVGVKKLDLNHIRPEDPDATGEAHRFNPVRIGEVKLPNYCIGTLAESTSLEEDENLSLVIARDHLNCGGHSLFGCPLVIPNYYRHDHATGKGRKRSPLPLLTWQCHDHRAAY